MRLKILILTLSILILFFIPGALFLEGDTAIEPEPAQIPETVSEEPDEFAEYDQEIIAKFTSPDLFSENHVLAYYGNPKSKIMGIVGRLSKEDLAAKLLKTAAEYDSLNGEKGVIPALYLIYGTCQPGGNINLMDKTLLEEYIHFALKKGFLVYIDHQIGKYSLDNALDAILPFLKYPNVHLAVDLEWRTSRPMKEIGYIRAQEMNQLQMKMQSYMINNGIKGQRQFVFHQFNAKMVRDISLVNATYAPVILVHATSGWGKPSVKLATHSRNAKAVNIPYKAFKLWYFYSEKKGVHYDNPIMSPAEVLALDPQPGMIIYQ
ncbi:MAG: hypothetical protein JW982_00330 [Spirochaetes bacterium]|nr:hypothetical protein [Spirochaetota bacterium]